MEKPVYGTKSPAFLDFVAPGCCITVIFFMALASAVGSLISEKNEGLLERSLVTGKRDFVLFLFQPARNVRISTIKLSQLPLFPNKVYIPRYRILITPDEFPV